MEQSEVTVRDGVVTSYVGPDAVNLMRARTLRVALNLYARSGMLVTRSATPTRLLAMAKEYTGKTYKRQPERQHYAQAATDVNVWISTMALAIPMIVDGERV